MHVEQALPIVAICLSVIGLIYQQVAIIGALRDRVMSLETKMDLFWKVIEQNVTRIIKDYPTNLKKDVLLDKMAKRELSLDEAYLLRTILHGEIDAGERETLAHILVLGRIEQIISDLMTCHCHHDRWRWFRRGGNRHARA